MADKLRLRVRLLPALGDRATSRPTTTWSAKTSTSSSISATTSTKAARAPNRSRAHDGPEIMTLDDYRNRYALYRSDPSLAARARAVSVRSSPGTITRSTTITPTTVPKTPRRATQFLTRRANAYQAYLRAHAAARGGASEAARDCSSIAASRSASWRISSCSIRASTAPISRAAMARSPLCERRARSQGHHPRRRAGALDVGRARQVAGTLERPRAAGADGGSRSHGRTGRSALDGQVGRLPGGSASASHKFLARAKAVQPDRPHRRHSHQLGERSESRLPRRRSPPTVGTEFVGTSITSGGDGQPMTAGADGILPENPHVRFYNAQRGYVSCTVTPDPLAIRLPHRPLRAEARRAHRNRRLLRRRTRQARRAARVTSVQRFGSIRPTIHTPIAICRMPMSHIAASSVQILANSHPVRRPSRAPRLAARARVHRDRHRLDRARHRRQHRDLHAGRSGAAPRRFRSSGPAGARAGHLARVELRQQLGRRQRAVVPDVQGPPRQQPGLQRHVRPLQLRRFTSATAGRTERVAGETRLGNYFPDARRRRGRSAACSRQTTISAPGGHPVAVLSHGFWTSRFAADPSSSARPIIVNGHPYTVIGVARAGFEGIELGTADAGLRADDDEGAGHAGLERARRSRAIAGCASSRG